MPIGTEKADELRHHDQRPRCGFRKPETVEHFSTRQPPIGLNGLLSHIGENRISTAESDDRQLAEKASLLRENIFTAQNNEQDRDRAAPKHAEHGD